MNSRIWSLALALMLFLCPTASLAEEMAPILVDRINSPKEYADFAFAEDAPLFEVIFPQILNCDAAYLRFGEETMLVDCATEGQAVRILNMCRQLGITHIDRVVITHPHADHIGGFRNLIKEVSVDELWINYPENCNDHMKYAVEAAKRAGIPVYTYKDGDVFTLGGATIEAWMLPNDMNRLNDTSAQLFITYGERTFLMAADLVRDGQKEMVALKGDRLDADILKYPHHGKEALVKVYQEAVSPLFMVVTNNHTKTEGYKAIRSSGIPRAYTVPGFVYLSTDGQTWIADRIVSEIKY